MKTYRDLQRNFKRGYPGSEEVFERKITPEGGGYWAIRINIVKPKSLATMFMPPFDAALFHVMHRSAIDIVRKYLSATKVIIYSTDYEANLLINLETIEGKLPFNGRLLKTLTIFTSELTGRFAVNLHSLFSTNSELTRCVREENQVLFAIYKKLGFVPNTSTTLVGSKDPSNIPQKLPVFEAKTLRLYSSSEVEKYLEYRRRTLYGKVRDLSKKYLGDPDHLSNFIKDPVEFVSFHLGLDIPTDQIMRAAQTLTGKTYAS